MSFSVSMMMKPRSNLQKASMDSLKGGNLNFEDPSVQAVNCKLTVVAGTRHSSESKHT